MRKHGLACDNLVGADVVTADGRLVHASETENPELLWGLRGGGGNFGIVTQFELALHPVGPIVYAGPIFYPADADRDLLRAVPRLGAERARRRHGAREPHDRAAAAGDPGGVARQEGRRVRSPSRPVPSRRATAACATFRAVAEPIADLLGPMPYNVIQTLLDPLWPKGIHAYFKATNLSRLDDELIERLVELHHAAPGPQAEIHVHQMGGAVGRVPAADTAFPDRTMPYVLNAVTGWHDPAQAEAHISWAREVVEAAADASTGLAYVNFLGDSGAGRSSYGEETYARLQALKQNTTRPTCSRATRTSDHTPAPRRRLDETRDRDREHAGHVLVSSRTVGVCGCRQAANDTPECEV